MLSGTGKQSMAKGSFGALLKREREMREVSRNEVTAATRIAAKFLRALEEEDWEKLPGGVFNRGYVRAVARYLGLDEENLLGEYDLAHGQQKTEAPVPFEDRIPAPPKWLVALALFVILLTVAGVVAAGVFGWRRYAAHRASKQSFVSAVPSQPQSPPSLPTLMVDVAPTTASLVSSRSLPLDLSVSTSAAAHVRVLADGQLLLDAELLAGETRHFSAREGFEVTASDSSAVLLELNGQAMPPLGVPGASGTILLSQKNLRQAAGGNAQP
jgi:cytoskeletal protein RodZ